MDSWYQPSHAHLSPVVRGIPVKPGPRKSINTSSPGIISIRVHDRDEEVDGDHSKLQI
ncbi:hypothetical protein LguiB_006045 [Lonicera macranthoides]